MIKAWREEQQFIRNEYFPSVVNGLVYILFHALFWAFVGLMAWSIKHSF